MIVSAEGSQLRLVTQPDHARVAAEILSLWRADGLPDHPRRADLLFATREHDNGWRETDAAPRANPATGRPYDFLDLPEAVRLETWARGTRRYADERPGAAALIALHALELHQDRRAAEPWCDLLSALDQQVAEYREAAGRAAAELRADYRWLRLADTLSLRACGALGDSFGDSGYRFERRGATLGCAPFPLAGATTFAVPCRRIPDRRYEGDADLATELAAARWQSFPVRLVALE